MRPATGRQRRWPWLLAALLALLASAAAFAQGSLEPDTNRPGSDIANFDLQAADPGLCRAACEREARCEAWTYVKPNTLQGPRPRCWLKNAVPAPRAEACCVSGVKAHGGRLPLSAADLAARTWEFGRGDGSVISRSLRLQPDGRIGGYSHPNEARWGVEGNTLVFFNDAGRPSTRFTDFRQQGGRWVISGAFLFAANVTHVLREAAPPAPVGAGMEDGTNRPGRDFANFDLAAADPALCQSACERDARCQAWVYVRPGTVQGPVPRCWLKDAVPPPRPEACCVSGVRATGGGGVVPLAAADLAARTWEFGRGDGSVISRSLQLLPDGRIGGYSHPNEARWALQGGALVFFASNGTPSTRFTVFRQEGGRWVISGPFLLGGNVTHILREVAGVPGGGGGAGVMAGINLPGMDYRDFDLAVADPAACRDTCEREAQCRAWTYVRPNTVQGPRPRCWLKAGVPAAQPNPCCDSGVKGGGVGPGPVGGGEPWNDPGVRSLVNEWLRQVESCTREVEFPRAYVDEWGRICGTVTTGVIDCSMKPDHPPGWDSVRYLWEHNFCEDYLAVTLRDYVARRQGGASPAQLHRCKAGRQAPCF